MPPSTWSTPRRSRPNQRRGRDGDSGGSGRSGALFGGCWAAGGDWDGDTAPGGVAVVGGDQLKGPGDQCHHLSHRPSPDPWRWHLPIPPAALCQLPQRWRWPRAPDREGWRRAAWRDGRERGDRATAGPPPPLNPALALLHHVPGLMGQVRVLTGCQMGGKRQDLHRVLRGLVLCMVELCFGSLHTLTPALFPQATSWMSPSLAFPASRTAASNNRAKQSEPAPLTSFQFSFPYFQDQSSLSQLILPTLPIIFFLFLLIIDGQVRLRINQQLDIHQSLYPYLFRVV